MTQEFMQVCGSATIGLAPTVTSIVSVLKASSWWHNVIAIESLGDASMWLATVGMTSQRSGNPAPDIRSSQDISIAVQVILFAPGRRNQVLAGTARQLTYLR